MSNDVKNDLRGWYAILAIAKEKPEKNSGFSGIRTRDLCDTIIAEVTGSNPAEAWIFFRLLFRNC